MPQIQDSPQHGGLSVARLQNGSQPHAQLPSSAPNTPDFIRRPHSIGKQTSLIQTLSLNQQNQEIPGNPHPEAGLESRRMIPLKKDKMELNERILRMGTDGHGMRPLSFHGSPNPKSSHGHETRTGIHSNLTSSLISLSGGSTPHQSSGPASPSILKKRQLTTPGTRKVHESHTQPHHKGQEKESKERNLNGGLHRRSLPPGNILQTKSHNNREKFG